MAFQFRGESRADLINNASITGWKEADLNFACIILQKLIPDGLTTQAWMI